MIASVLLSKIKALCGALVLLLATSVTYDTVPNSTSNEADWVEFVAKSVLNVEDEGIEYTLPDRRRSLLAHSIEHQLSSHPPCMKSMPRFYPVRVNLAT